MVELIRSKLSLTFVYSRSLSTKNDQTPVLLIQETKKAKKSGEDSPTATNIRLSIAELWNNA